MNRLEKMMRKERYLRGGAIQLNLLKYDIIWVTSRWGFLGKENACEFFDFVSKLFHEDKDVKAALESKKKSGSKKKKEEAVAKTEPEAAAKKEFVLPERNSNNDRLVQYLSEVRGLSDEVIDYFLSQDLIYETKQYHNICFLGSLA